MTLNGVIGVVLRYYTKFRSFRRPIMRFSYWLLHGPYNGAAL